MHAKRFILTSLIMLSGTALGDYFGVTISPLIYDAFTYKEFVQTCVLDEAHPPPGTCRYSPDEGIALDEPCDSTFPVSEVGQ